MAKPLWRSCPWGPSANIRNKHGEKPRAGRFNIGVNGISRCFKCRGYRYYLAEILHNYTLTESSHLQLHCDVSRSFINQILAEL